MEQAGPPSGISGRGVFKHHREYPELPEGYDWETQKKHYCPQNLRIKSRSGQSGVKHEFGYVFCHRGLYERAEGILDNSGAAIENGIKQGFFLHEVDAFVLEKLDKAFVAHDKSPRRVTSKKEVWRTYSFHEIITTPLVTRRVNMKTPDFASSYLETDEKVLGLMQTLWDERLDPVGRTLQIDLRDEEFARAIPYYSFHLSKLPYQHAYLRGAHRTLVWSVFESTILKGYNEHFTSFDHLHHEIRKSSEETYARNYFDVRHLHMLPPLIMVFYAGPLIKLAKNTEPAKGRPRDRTSYEHLHDTFKNQVRSFIRVGPDKYNFILEIVHSGLGLGYDRTKPEQATNPLDGEPLESKDVIFESRVDRVMIDVGLELRKEYPDLLFSSCTRLPDVITSDGKYKAKFETSRLVPLKEGEEGLSTRLRAMHGGLYPPSHLVVADDPMAEIAARTWIDQKMRLNRRELLHTPYYKWIAQAGPRAVDSLRSMTDHNFQPNRVGDPVPVHTSPKRSPTNSNAAIGSWLEGVLSPHNVQDPSGANRQSEGYENEGEFACSQPSNALGHDLLSVSDERTWKERESRSGTRGKETRVTIDVAGKRFNFGSEAEAKRAVASLAAYKAAERGNEEALQKLLSNGVNVNASTGLYGSALAVACTKGHGTIVKLLLDSGANVDGGGKGFGSPLELASEHGHDSIVDMLLTVLIKNNVYPGTSQRVYTGTALHRACDNGHETIVRLLLNKGADVNLTGGAPHTALQAACKNGRYELVKLLLDNGADVNILGGFGDTALQAACIRGHHDIVKLLLHHGANVNTPAENHDSALYSACIYGHATIAELLLDEGAAIDFPCRDTFEPKIVSLLVKAGAKVVKHEPESHPDQAMWLKELSRRRRVMSTWKKAKKLREINAPPLKPPPKLRSCGCLLCIMDQAIQPALFTYGPSRVRIGDPIQYTLNQMRQHARSS